MENVTMGIDLGKQRDYTAIIVCELGEGDTYNVRHIERPRLRTSYPRIIKRVEKIRDRVKKLTGAVPTIYLDATGVGLAVADEFQAKGVDVVPVTITAGAAVTREGRELHVGKEALVARLAVLLADGRIHWNGSTSLGKALTTELHRFQLRVNEKSASLQFEAERGSHDDLTISLALAVLEKPMFVGVTSVEWGNDQDPEWQPWPG